MSDFLCLSQILNTDISLEIIARNIWNSIEVWRTVSLFAVLLLIFCKKKIRFFIGKEEKIETDRNVFIGSDLIITEDFLKEILIELSINESYNISKYKKITCFYNFYQKGENKYINELLNESVQSFTEALNELQTFLDKHFSEIKTEGVFRLYPDLKHDPSFNYIDFREELNKLCRNAESSYSKYRVNIKTTLCI